MKYLSQPSHSSGTAIELEETRICLQLLRHSAMLCNDGIDRAFRVYRYRSLNIETDRKRTIIQTYNGV